MNHHILAKITTDSVLGKFKTEEWDCGNGLGKDFFRVPTDSAFPSPDAAFYDEDKKFLVSFEFKPPTETKRGVLTGVGQTIAYLQQCNVSYLIAPEYLEDYRLGDYLTELFEKQISGKIPSGLILYSNEKPEEVSMACNIVPTLQYEAQTNIKTRGVTASRYWAKHQDLPIPFFHLLLHCYFLKKSHTINEDAFKYCWKNYMISPKILDDFKPSIIYDCNNNIIKTLRENKNLMFLEKILDKLKNVDKQERIQKIKFEIDTEYSGDNKYNAYRKNYVTFLKHLKVIDSVGELTDSGFKLYELGLVNGANSKVFRDYFTKEVLTTGHHLDLILDLDNILRNNPEVSFSECLAKMENQYELKGLLKRNPNRKAANLSNVSFLKYECILWRSLGILVKDTQKVSHINWKKITEVCSLPEL